MMAPRKSSRIPTRYVMTAMGFWGFFNIYAMRVNLSVAMVVMVNQTVEMSSNYTTNDVECSMLLNEEKSIHTIQKGGQYNWDAKTQSLILGSFFYGYVVTQLPGGYFAEKFGAKWIFGIGVLVTAIFSLVTPLAASWGVPAFIIVRVLEGFGEGVTFPAMNALVSRWSPKLERSRLTTIIYSGCQIGNVIAMPISGVLCSSTVFGGWPSVFYVFGALGCIWFVLWAYFVYETPADHPHITPEELFYIQEGQGDHTANKKPPTPWKSILTSVPVWAVVISHFGHSWGFLILLTELPSYLSKILHFNIKANGGLSALPYLMQAISAWLASYVADRIRKSGRLQITAIRKIFNSIGLFGPAICLLGVTVSGCQPMLIVGLITLAMALNGLTYSGFNVTHVDMSPDYAGTLYGLSNTFANLNGFIGPAVVGYFTTDGNTIASWSNVFYITAAMYTLTAVVYIILATAEQQPWGLASAASTNKQTRAVKMVNLQMETRS